MQPLGYPSLDAGKPGFCESDGSLTRTQLPSGDYLCPACVRDYRKRGWLAPDFEYTEAFFAAHPHLWGLRVRRKARGHVVVDPQRLAVELRRLIASGEPVEVALRRLQSEARVGHFQLVPVVTLVLGVDPREARRLVVHAVGSSSSATLA